MKKKKQDPRPAVAARRRQTEFEQTFWGHNPSPNFGQDKAWVREGRDPSWSKDREHLMRIFNENVESQSFSKEDFSYLFSRRFRMPTGSHRRDRWEKEYDATGLGSASRAMRLLPVPISDKKTQEDYIAAVKDTDMYKGDQWGVPSLEREGGAWNRDKFSSLAAQRELERKARARAAPMRASSIPNTMNLSTRNRLSRTVPVLHLDHKRDKSLDTPAVAREMAHYDQLHGYLQKQDKGVRTVLNVFRGGGFTRR
jgi:hypothetical protein